MYEIARILHSCPKIIKIAYPHFYDICPKIDKIPEFYMIFGRKMPEFFIVIARRIFFADYLYILKISIKSCLFLLSSQRH